MPKGLTQRLAHRECCYVGPPQLAPNRRGGPEKL